MTDNLRKFLEAASADEAFAEKLSKAKTAEAVIALAAEKGFTLTEEEIRPKERSGEISDDEMDAVAGGAQCGCFLGGFGKEGGSDYMCVCPVGGGGGSATLDESRCICALGGIGIDTNP